MIKLKVLKGDYYFTLINFKNNIAEFINNTTAKLKAINNNLKIEYHIINK